MSHDVISGFSAQNVLKKYWRKQKYGKIGQPNIIFSKELYYSFKMMGQPLLYDNWLKRYGFLNMTYFQLKSADVTT